MRPWILIVGLFSVSALFSSCKQATQGGDSQLNADASAVASGQEILFTRNSNPEPQPPPKLTPEDFDPELHELQLKAFYRLDVGKYQIPGSDLTGTPRPLQGIWWMDGNPMFDETVSFANADFSQKHPLLAVFGANNFTFHAGLGTDLYADNIDYADKEGLQAYEGARKLGLAYELHFENDGKDFSKGHIVPTILAGVGKSKKRLRVSKDILEFTFVNLDEHTYLRGHAAGGKPLDASYTFRRILIPSESDPKVLEKTKWWERYAAQRGPIFLRLPARKG